MSQVPSFFAAWYLLGGGEAPASSFVWFAGLLVNSSAALGASFSSPALLQHAGSSSSSPPSPRLSPSLPPPMARAGLGPCQCLGPWHVDCPHVCLTGLGRRLWLGSRLEPHCRNSCLSDGPSNLGLYWVDVQCAAQRQTVAPVERVTMLHYRFRRRPVHLHHLDKGHDSV